MNDQDLVYRLRKRAEIRRQIQSRKSVQEGKPDRLADLLEEAATEIATLRDKPKWSKYTLDEQIAQCGLSGSVVSENDIVSPVTDLNGLENKPISLDSVEDVKIQSMQSLKKEMLEVARGEQKAPTDAGNISFESVEAAKAWVVRNTDDLSAHGGDIANTGIAGAEFDATNPVKKSLSDVLAKFAKLSPAFISEGRGDQEQDRIISNRDGISCPVCGPAKLAHDTRDMPYTYKGQSTNIPALIGDFCPVCTKFIFDLDEARRAMNLMREFENKVDGK